MRLRLILSCVAACGMWMATGVAQEPFRPSRVTPRPAAPPAQPETPTGPAPSQQKVIVAPAAQTLSAEQLTAIALQAVPPEGATREEQAAMTRVSERLRHKDRAAAQTDWEFLVERAARRDDKHKDWINLESWSNYVLNRAYLEPDPDLKYHAEKVRFHHAQKTAAHERRAELERAQRELQGRAGSTRTVTVRSVTIAEEFEPGRSAVRLGPEVPQTVESVADELQGIVVLCNRLDDESQQANLDLQNAVQKQQQTLQTMSNVSKMLHDTAKNMINNVR